MSGATVITLITTTHLQSLIQRITDGHARAIRGGADWIEGTLEVASALREARDTHPPHMSFSQWLKENGVNFYGEHDRAGLIGMAADLTLAREILMETKSRSYDLIWAKNKGRFAKIPKPRRQATHQNVSRMRMTNHRAMKLGEATLELLKGTSLDYAPELDELVVLNRGAEEGTLTPLVQRLVADAVAGKMVSAVALSGRRTAPTLMEAWKKRMAFAWSAASDADKTALVELLLEEVTSASHREMPK